MESFKAGVIQFDVALGDARGNVDKALGFLEDLAGQGASLGVLPEMFPFGFDNDQIRTHALETPGILARFSAFARDHALAVAGSFPEIEGPAVYNTLYFIDRDGQVKGAYRKLHLFRLTDEHRYYTPGSQMVTAQTGLGPMGLMICYDLRFPELARTLVLSGARMLIVPAQWPDARADHWQTLLRARAIENQVFVLGSNRTGADADLVFPGLSAVIDPWGKVLAEAGDREGVAVANLDLGQVEAVRQTIPVMSDRRGDIYG